MMLVSENPGEFKLYKATIDALMRDVEDLARGD